MHPRVESQRDEAHGDGVQVARARDLPEADRMPGVQQDALTGELEQGQQAQEKDAHHAFKADHRELHEGFCRADPGHREEEHLRGRRVDGVRVLLAIDVGVNLAIAQKLEFRRRRNIAVGVDTGGLHLAVPHIAVDIA